MTFTQFIMGDAYVDQAPDRTENARKNLAAVRIFYFLVVLMTVSGPDYFLQWMDVPPQFWQPNGILRLFAEPLSRDFMTISFHVWRWLTLACLIGAFYKWLAPIWWLAGLLVTTNGHSYGYLGHVYMPVILAGLPLCFSLAADAFSFDSWLSSRGSSLKKPDRDFLTYALPVRTIQIVFIFAYFAAGVSKLRFGGIEWITSDTLRNYLVRSSLVFSDSNQIANSLQLNSLLFKYSWLCHLLAFGAVALELIMPLALWKRRFAFVLIPAVVALQIGIFFTLFVRFTPYMALIGAWIDWSFLSRLYRKPQSLS